MQLGEVYQLVKTWCQLKIFQAYWCPVVQIVILLEWSRISIAGDEQYVPMMREACNPINIRKRN